MPCESATVPSAVSFGPLSGVSRPDNLCHWDSISGKASGQEQVRRPANAVMDFSAQGQWVGIDLITILRSLFPPTLLPLPDAYARRLTVASGPAHRYTRIGNFRCGNKITNQMQWFPEGPVPEG